MRSEDREMERIYAIHALTAWNAYGTFDGSHVESRRSKFQISEVSRPPSVRRFSETTNRECVLHVLRKVYAADPSGRAVTPSAGNLNVVKVRLIDDRWALFGVSDQALQVEGNVSRERVSAMLFDQVQGSPFLVLLSAEVDVAAAKYGARAWRFAFLEAGHIAEALMREAESVGLRTCPIGGFNDTLFDELVTTSEGRELPLYIVAIGNLPTEPES